MNSFQRIAIYVFIFGNLIFLLTLYAPMIPETYGFFAVSALMSLAISCNLAAGNLTEKMIAERGLGVEANGFMRRMYALGIERYFTAAAWIFISIVIAFLFLGSHYDGSLNPIALSGPGVLAFACVMDYWNDLKVFRRYKLHAQKE